MEAEPTTTPTLPDTPDGVGQGGVHRPSALASVKPGLTPSSDDEQLAQLAAKVEQLSAKVDQVLAVAVTLARQVQAWDEVLATLANGSVGKALALVTRRKATPGG